MSVKRVRYVAAALLVLLMVFAGSQDAIEVDEEVYALAVGVDLGVSNKVRITVQFPTYKNSSGGGEGAAGIEKKNGGGAATESGIIDGTVVITVDASNILEGIDLLNMSVPRKISLTHTKLLVISEEFARNGIEMYLAPMARFRETRGVTNVVISRSKAEEFIEENKSFIGDSPSKAIELLVSQSKNNGYFPQITFQQFYKAILSSYEQAYATYAGVNDFSSLVGRESREGREESPMITDFSLLPGNTPRNGGSKRELGGTAVFDGAKMVGYLDALETRYFLMVLGKFERGIVTLEDKNAPDYVIPLDMRLGRKPKIKARFENGVPVIDVEVNIEADIGAIQSRIEYEKLDRINELNRQIEEQVKEGIENVIRKTQKEFKADIFGFGRVVSSLFKTIPEWENYEWLSRYPDAKVNVTVKANVRRTGLLIRSFPLKKQ